MRPSGLGIRGTVRRRRGDNVGSAAGTIVDRRGRARGDEDGGVGIRHIFGEGVKLVGEDLLEVSVEGRASTAETKQILFETVVVAVEDCEWRSQCEGAMGN